MKSTFIVLAHPEPDSFNGAWFRASVEASQVNGDTVSTSDLVGQGFDPVERRDHFAGGVGVSPAGPFDPLKFQESAAASGAIPGDVAAEIDKIRQADRLILHFPMWWFGPPAILKGWFDRCLMHGALHTSQDRFDRGMCQGKKALFCVTTGASSAEASSAGKEGDARLLLWPLAYALRYLGFTVLQPLFVHGVHGYHKDEAKTRMESRLHQTLKSQAGIIAGFDQLPKMSFNRDSDFDERGLLKPQAPSRSPFIRH